MLKFNPFTGKLDIVNSTVITVDTKANILASTATSGKLAFSSDTLEFFSADGTTWRKMPFVFVADSANPDMGFDQTSSRIGYGTWYITDKTLNNVVVGHNGTAGEGGIRIDPTTANFQVYQSGGWQTLVANFIFREDSTFGYTLEHAPTGFTNYIEVMTGQTLSNLGMNGLPLTNGYQTVMGAYGVCSKIGGRTV